jgi:hypothetical protein
MNIALFLEMAAEAAPDHAGAGAADIIRKSGDKPYARSSKISCSLIFKLASRRLNRRPLAGLAWFLEEP